MRKWKITIHVVSALGKITAPIRPIDFPHGSFEADKDEKLTEFLSRNWMPYEDDGRMVLPEWGITYEDLSGKISQYDIRDGDTIYMMSKLK